jgi:hypothetical protein
MIIKVHIMVVISELALKNEEERYRAHVSSCYFCDLYYVPTTRSQASQLVTVSTLTHVSKSGPPSPLSMFLLPPPKL